MDTTTRSDHNPSGKARPCWWRLAMIWVVVAWGAWCGMAAAQAVRDRGPITMAFADWQARQKTTKTARYTLSGTVELLKSLDSEAQLPPEGDRTRPLRATVLIDIERKRLRIESTEFVLAQGGRYQKRMNSITCNGVEKRQSQSRETAEENGGFDLLIAKVARGEEPGNPISDLYWPILFAHGIIPTVHQPPFVERLPLTWSDEDFVAHGRHVLNGRACQVLRTEPQLGMGSISDEYWVDMSHRGAIVRYVYLTGAQPWFRYDIEWAETPTGWGPRKWSNTFTANGKEVNKISTLTVDQFEMNPDVADSDFTIPAVPGMKQVIVAEEPPAGVRVAPGSPGRRIYTITDKGEWIEIAAEGWKRFDTQTSIPLPSRRDWLWWAIGCSVVLSTVGWFLHRRRRLATQVRSVSQ